MKSSASINKTSGMKISKVANEIAVSILLLNGVNVLAVNSNGNDNDKEKMTKPFTLQDARKIARLELEDLFDREENGWTRGRSKVKDGFPIYVEGQYEEPAYFEFAIETQGEDDGSILVNVDKTDVVVPEVSVGGKALFKQYQALLGKKDIFVIRHDAFQSLSVEGDNPDDEGAIKAVAGFDEGDPLSRMPDDSEKAKIKEIRQEARDIRKAKIDGRSEEEEQAYEEYYTVVEEIMAATPDDENADRMLRRSQKLTTFEYHYYAVLQNWFGEVNGHRWYLPQFSQTYRYGCPVGCANTAWAMVLAYYDQFKVPYYNLFPGTVDWQAATCCSAYSVASNVMWDLNAKIPTNCGWTLTAHIPYGIEYLKDYGFQWFSRFYWYKGTVTYEYDHDWDYIYQEILNDRPAISWMKAGGIGTPDHYVAVQGAYRRELLDGWGSKNHTFFEDRYYVNYGWGDVQKWITVDASLSSGVTHTMGGGYRIKLSYHI